MAPPAAVDVLEVMRRASELQAGIAAVARLRGMDPDGKVLLLKVTVNVMKAV